jgi:hypothetical protein
MQIYWCTMMNVTHVSKTVSSRFDSYPASTHREMNVQQFLDPLSLHCLLMRFIHTNHSESHSTTAPPELQQKTVLTTVPADNACSIPQRVRGPNEICHCSQTSYPGQAPTLARMSSASSIRVNK